MAYAHEINYSSQEELDAAREATRNKWRDLYAGHIEEGRRHGRSELESMDRGVSFSRVMTPEENREYRWAFEPLGTKAWPWRKWGGGNKMGIGGAKAVAARKARAEARRSAPDANVNNYTNKNLADHLGLTAVSNFVDSRLNAVQGKPLAPNPSWGFSQKTLNEAGARGADPSFAGEAGRNVYGGDMTRSTPSIGSSGTSFSNYTGGLPAGGFLTNFGKRDFSSFTPRSILGDTVRSSMVAGGIPYGTPGADDPFADHDDTPIDLNDDSDFPDDLFGIGDIRASIPRFAGIFAV